MTDKKIIVDNSWSSFFQTQTIQPYFQQLLANIKVEYQNYVCYPQWEDIFYAFKVTPLSQVKVVILGQDPYHQPQQAHGLAFSVQANVPLPPSLKNIFQELQSDLNVVKGNNGNLVSWAQQGVLLLNTTLTVRKSEPNSHLKYGWPTFTDGVLQFLNDHCDKLVFILWGRNARNKKALINAQKHYIIESAHPSPLSAYHGFFNSQPFSKTNKWLISQGKKQITW